MILKGIAIEGGGSKGAFTAGKLEALDNDYQVGSGISTGALMIMLVLRKYWFPLKQAYTGLKTKNITEVSAFNKKGRPNVLRIIWRIILGKETAGESYNLRSLIENFIDDQVFYEIKDNDQIAMVSAYSLTCEELVDFTTDDFKEPRHFKDFTWASANAGPAMSILRKNRPNSLIKEEWTDGSFSDGHSANRVFDLLYLKNAELIKSGIVEHIEVDLFLHRKKPVFVKKKPIQNIPHFILRYINALLQGNQKDDLTKAIIAAKQYKGILNVHYLPDDFTSNPLIFDTVEMKRWYRLGRRMANYKSLIVKYDFRKNG